MRSDSLLSCDVDYHATSKPRYHSSTDTSGRCRRQSGPRANNPNPSPTADIRRQAERVCFQVKSGHDTDAVDSLFYECHGAGCDASSAPLRSASTSDAYAEWSALTLSLVRRFDA